MSHDTQLQEAVLAALKWEPSIAAGHVGVTAKENAARNIRPLFGVIGISDQITMKLRMNVLDISDDIMDALHRSRFDPKTIKVSTARGAVRLSGSVHSPHDRWTASEAAWAAPDTISVDKIAIV